jgi:hypothetical protein
MALYGGGMFLLSSWTSHRQLTMPHSCFRSSCNNLVQVLAEQSRS